MVLEERDFNTPKFGKTFDFRRALDFMMVEIGRICLASW